MRNPSQTLLALLLVAHGAGMAQQTAEEPRESGLVESAAVELVLIDVDARDSDGNPMRGLTQGDFQVSLNGRDIEVETLDDLCNCGLPASVRRTRFTPRHFKLFVLYFDFSQMDEVARPHAVDEAKRWVRNVPQQTTRVMVAAYSSGTGIEPMTQFVEPQETLRALNELAKAKRFKDPWPLERMAAIQQCGDDPTKCLRNAEEDMDHSRRSLRALLFFLTSIESERASKTMLFFSQVLTAAPANIYGPSRLAKLLEKPTPKPGAAERNVRKNFDFRVGDQWNLLREVAGTAFLSRTTVYPIYAGGGDQRWSTNFSANLAQQTGGEYNRGLSDLRETMRHAEERCPCTYRIGIRPTRLGVQARSRLKVQVRGEMLITMNDVRFPNAMDRWHRRAEAVLRNPEASRELPLEASLIPALNAEGKWRMTAVVSFDARALEMLPAGDRVKGQWEVGALVVNRRSGKFWEMLGVSEVTSKSKPGDRAYIVHEYSFPEAKPGEYEIRAFIRDKWTNVFGGDRGVLTLPKPGAGVTVGPLTMLAAADQVRTTLPLRKKKIQATHRDTAQNTTGPVPIGDGPLEPGVQLRFASWACGNKGAPPAVHDAMVLGAQGGRRLAPPDVRVVGDCAEATSVIDTDGLAQGEYEYVIRWDLGGNASTNGSAPFALAGPNKTAPVR